MIILIPSRDAVCAHPEYAFSRAEEELLHDSRQPRLIDGDLQLTDWAIRSSLSANPVTALILAHDCELPEAFHVACFRKLKAALLPGIDDDDIAFCAVLHREGMRQNPPRPRHACHAYVANRHLATDIQLQPYFHNADRLILELFQEVTNIEHGLASPKDSFRARQENYIPDWIKGDRRQLESELQAEAVAARAIGCFADSEKAAWHWRGLGFDNVVFGRCRNGAPFVKLYLSETERPIILKGEIYGLENQPDPEADRRSALFGQGGLERTPQRAQLLRGELDKEIERKRRYLERVLAPARARVVAAPALGWGDFVRGGVDRGVSGDDLGGVVRLEGVAGAAGDGRHQELRGAAPAGGEKTGNPATTGGGGAEPAGRPAGVRPQRGDDAQPAERTDKAPSGLPAAPIQRPSHRTTLPVHGVASGSAPDGDGAHVGRGPNSPLGLTIPSTTQKEKHDLEPRIQNSYFTSAEPQRAGDPTRHAAGANRPDEGVPGGGDRSLPALTHAMLGSAGNALEGAGNLANAFDEFELSLGRLDDAIRRALPKVEVTETRSIPPHPWNEGLNVIWPDLSAPPIADKPARDGVGRMGRDRVTIVKDLPSPEVGD